MRRRRWRWSCVCSITGLSHDRPLPLLDASLLRWLPERGLSSRTEWPVGTSQWLDTSVGGVGFCRRVAGCNGSVDPMMFAVPGIPSARIYSCEPEPTPWKRWFAWYPVSEVGWVFWLQFVEWREYPPTPGFADGWFPGWREYRSAAARREWIVDARTPIKAIQGAKEWIVRRIFEIN